MWSYMSTQREPRILIFERRPKCCRTLLSFYEILKFYGRYSLLFPPRFRIFAFKTVKFRTPVSLNSIHTL